jgi:hypothetical protein
MYRYLLFTIVVLVVIGLLVFAPESVEAGKAWCRDCRGR